MNTVVLKFTLWKKRSRIELLFEAYGWFIRAHYIINWQLLRKPNVRQFSFLSDFNYSMIFLNQSPLKHQRSDKVLLKGLCWSDCTICIDNCVLVAFCQLHHHNFARLLALSCVIYKKKIIKWKGTKNEDEMLLITTQFFTLSLFPIIKHFKCNILNNIYFI